MSDECIICKAPLEYLEKDEELECAICHKKENSKTRCVKGHYVCNDCHTKGIDATLRQADWSNKGVVDACMYSLLRSEWED